MPGETVNCNLRRNFSQQKENDLKTFDFDLKFREKTVGIKKEENFINSSSVI